MRPLAPPPAAGPAPDRMPRPPAAGPAPERRPGPRPHAPPPAAPRRRCALTQRFLNGPSERRLVPASLRVACSVSVLEAELPRWSRFLRAEPARGGGGLAQGVWLRKQQLAAYRAERIAAGGMVVAALEAVLGEVRGGGGGGGA
jgi:hypothetical protein